MLPNETQWQVWRRHGEGNELAMLSSVAGGGGNDAAAVFDADTGAGGDTVGGAWLTGFFFDVVFFSGMVMCGR